MYWSVVWCSGGCSWKCYKTITLCSLLTRCTIPRACHAKRHLNLQKWSEALVCFVHFDLEMCFAPQRRALFRHLNFQKWSDSWVCFVHFDSDFEMCFAPQWRALFRHLNFQKWSGECCVLYILIWKCASRHNGVQFFISHLASWLRTRRFSEPTFRPSGATNHWKNTVFRDFPTFSRICIFFLLTLSLLLFSLLIVLFSLPLPYSAFHLSILSEVWLQKLPSTILYNLVFM